MKQLEETYKCQSYYDDNNTLRNCTCGECYIVTADTHKIVDHFHNIGQDEMIYTKNLKLVQDVINDALSKQRQEVIEEIRKTIEEEVNVEPVMVDTLGKEYRSATQWGVKVTKDQVFALLDKLEEER